MPKVEAVRTPISPDELGMEFLRQENLSRPALRILLAHWAGETGWGKSMWNHNVGNRKSSGKSGDWMFISCTERVNRATGEKMIDADPQRVSFENADDATNGKPTVLLRIEPEHPWSRFSAYDSFPEGAAAYLSMMKQDFPRSWEALVTGDAQHFVGTLKEEGYFTASLESYQALFDGVLRSVDSRASVALASASEVAPSPLASSPARSRAVLFLLGLLAVGAMTLRRKSR
jgi:hypothetical protein